MNSGGDLGGVTIGAREIYDKLVEVSGDVRSLTEGRAADIEEVADIKQRLSAVERWVWAIPAAVVTGVASVVTVLLVK